MASGCSGGALPIAFVEEDLDSGAAVLREGGDIAVDLGHIVPSIGPGVGSEGFGGGEAD